MSGNDSMLWKIYIELTQVADEFTDRLVMRFFNALKWVATDKLVKAIENQSALMGFDENIYDSCDNVMKYFGRISELYMTFADRIMNTDSTAEDKITLESEKEEVLTKIFGMIDPVYRYYMGNFETNNGFADGTDRSSNSIEINLILANAANRLSNMIEFTKGEFLDIKGMKYKELFRKFFFTEKQTESGDGADYHVAEETANQISGDIVVFCVNEIYKSYNDALRSGITGLSELCGRRTAKYDIGYLDNLKDTLQQVMNVDYNGEDSELLELINLIREHGQSFTNKYDMLTVQTRKFTEEDRLTQETEQVDFNNELSRFVQSKLILPSSGLSETRNIFLCRLDDFNRLYLDNVTNRLMNRLNRFDSSNISYACSKQIMNQLVLTDELIAAFQKIPKAYEAIQSGITDDIISGISETIKIKIEGLSENKLIFKEDCDCFAEEIKNSGVCGDETVLNMLETAARSCLDDFFNLANGSGLSEAQFYISLRESYGSKSCDDLLISAEERYNKLLAMFTERLDKRIYQYYKENLLYEVSTFEELLRYSVSKLRDKHKILQAAELNGTKHDGDKKKEMECAFLSSFIRVIDDTARIILIILKKNNILLIEPRPHEVFNSKEHEILTAEKNGEFAKGEIIKPLNCGFRHNDKIVIRANVVAAK